MRVGVLASYTLSLAVFIPISGWGRGPVRHPARVHRRHRTLFTLGSFLCGISSNIHVLVACRILQGCGGSMMVPVGRLTLVRGTFAKADLDPHHELCRHPVAGCSDARAHRRRPYRRLPALARHLLSQYSHWTCRSHHGLSAPARLPRRDARSRYRGPHSLRFRHCTALLRAGRSSATTRSARWKSRACWFSRSACWRATGCTPENTSPTPCCSSACSKHSHLPRLGEWGAFLPGSALAACRSLLPLLYQVGLGFTPVQSGLLIMPQALAAMSMKPFMPRLLSATRLSRCAHLQHDCFSGLLLLLFA